MPSVQTSKPMLRLIRSDDLTGAEEQDLISYINWADGIHSSLGAVVNAIEQYGALGVAESSGNGTENAMIAALDRKVTYRRIHQVMLSVGDSARVLTRAYLLDRKPAYIDKAFGRLAGVVLGKVDDVEALADACRRQAMGSATPADRKAISELRIASQRAFNAATSAYAKALRAIPKQPPMVAATYLIRKSPAHVCRAGGSHQNHVCPCGQSL